MLGNIWVKRLHQWYQYSFLQRFSVNNGAHLVAYDLKWWGNTKGIDSAVYKIWNSIQGYLAFFYHEIFLVEGSKTPSCFCWLQGNDCYYFFPQAIFKQSHLLCCNRKRMFEPFGIQAFHHCLDKPCICFVFVNTSKSLTSPSKFISVLYRYNAVSWCRLLPFGVLLQLLIPIL